jgi:hypothetical protein
MVARRRHDASARPVAVSPHLGWVGPMIKVRRGMRVFASFYKKKCFLFFFEKKNQKTFIRSS